MGLSLLVGLIVVFMAFVVSVAVGFWRGPILGIAMGFGVLVVGCVGYVGLLTLALPM